MENKPKMYTLSKSHREGSDFRFHQADMKSYASPTQEHMLKYREFIVNDSYNNKNFISQVKSSRFNENLKKLND